MRYEMLYDRLLIRPIEADNRTKGGLYVPDMVNDNTPYFRGEVMEVGHGRLAPDGKAVPLVIAQGDVVLFFRYPPEQIIMPGDDGKDLMVIREPHVIAVLRDLPKATSLVGTDGGTLVLQ